MEKKRTSFGKELRKMMIDSDESLIDLAKVLNVTIPFVSSVLNGNKNVPSSWFDIIENHYDLNKKEIENLKILAEESKNSIKFDLSNCNNNQRGLAVQLQRNLSNLDDEDIEKIKEILKGEIDGF